MSGEPYAQLVEMLASDPSVRLAYAFGSAASGVAGPLSDVDVAVLLDVPPDWDSEREFRGRLDAASPHVDLVILNAAHPPLRFEVVTTGRCLLARDAREQAEFELLSISPFLDFQPVRRVQQDHLRARVEERRGSAG